MADTEVIEILTAAFGAGKVQEVAEPHHVVGTPCRDVSGSASPAVSSGWINNAKLIHTDPCVDRRVRFTALAITQAAMDGQTHRLVQRWFILMQEGLDIARSAYPRRRVMARRASAHNRNSAVARFNDTFLYPGDILNMVEYQAERETYNTIPVHAIRRDPGDKSRADIVPAGAAAVFLARLDKLDWAASASAPAGASPDPAAADGPYSDAVRLLESIARAVLASADSTMVIDAHIQAAQLLSST